MDVEQDNDLIRMRELLQRTGEFIAYFELVETKMLHWRQDMEQHMALLQKSTHSLQQELTLVHQFFSPQDVAQFQNTMHNALTQGDKHLTSLSERCEQFTHQIELQKQHLIELTDRSLSKIEQHTTQALHQIGQTLSKYDPHQFHRIASESCDHVERAASDAVIKSNKLLNTFQLRFNFVAVLTTLITAFFVVLYLSDEFPWEMHHQAMKERQAGKVLLQAWPNLSQVEKNKIVTPIQASTKPG